MFDAMNTTFPKRRNLFQTFGAAPEGVFHFVEDSPLYLCGFDTICVKPQVTAIALDTFFRNFSFTVAHACSWADSSLLGCIITLLSCNSEAALPL